MNRHIKLASTASHRLPIKVGILGAISALTVSLSLADSGGSSNVNAFSPIASNDIEFQEPLTISPAEQPEEIPLEYIDNALVQDLLVLPPIPPNMDRLADEIIEIANDDFNFATLQIREDRSSLVLYWYGDIPSFVEELIERQPDVKVEIRETEFQPGVLRKVMREILAENENVTAVSMNPDGSGIQVFLAGAPQNQRNRSLVNYFSDLPFPVQVEYGSFSPANSRQNDRTFRLGGARINMIEDSRIVGRCTSGFAALRPNNESVMITAAHCGPDGSWWGAVDMTNATFTPWGNISARTARYDAAIISSPNGWAQPFIWVNAWDSASVIPIHGVLAPRIGDEVCMSGSFSGLVCGNLVENTKEYYLSSNPQVSVSGFISRQLDNVPAAGNGDSGGPVFRVVNSRFYAIGIISAIPLDSPPVCQGVPGGGGATATQPLSGHRLAVQHLP